MKLTKPFYLSATELGFTFSKKKTDTQTRTLKQCNRFLVSLLFSHHEIEINPIKAAIQEIEEQVRMSKTETYHKRHQFLLKPARYELNFKPR